MPEFKRILLPTDFSEHSLFAGKYVRMLAGLCQSEIHLLHVTENFTQFEPRVYAAEAIEGITKHFDNQSRQELTQLLAQDWATGQSISIQTRAGKPATEIIRYAEENEIDLIVMSTHGRAGIGEAFIGSVAERVFRQATCPVLTIRPDGQPTVSE